MENVAQYLQDQALSRTGEEGRDAFGRSSFNRYYYAAFIETRNMMSSLKSEWTKTPHKQIPTVLLESVVPSLKQAYKKAIRIDDKATVLACTTAISATKDLAVLLENSFATRVVADYRLETKVIFKADDYTLNLVSISIARHWPAKARGFTASILNGWRQAGE